jgi:hypothetical protein
MRNRPAAIWSGIKARLARFDRAVLFAFTLSQQAMSSFLGPNVRRTR